MLGKLFKIQNPKGVMGLNKRNLQLIYPNNKREHYALADDKVKTKEILHQHNISCAETYAVITKVSDIRKQWENCRSKKALAIKPANGCGGGGIKILKKNKKNEWMSGGMVVSERDIFNHITCIVSGYYSMGSFDSCLIEECIVAHPFFAEIYDEGVPDFRIITLKSKPIMAMLRMPTSKSDGKANLHQKGVGIGIAMDKGELTQVFDGKKYLDHHPDNATSIVGKKIPFWKEMMDLAIQVSEVFPLEYLGVDLVIDKDKGPQIMELNVRPGLGIQLVNQQGLEKAIAQNYE